MGLKTRGLTTRGFYNQVYNQVYIQETYNKGYYIQGSHNQVSFIQEIYNQGYYIQGSQNQGSYT